MDKSFSRLSIKLLFTLLLTLMFSCTKTDSPVNGEHKNSISLTDQRDNQENNDITRLDHELEGEDEFISKKLFQKWKGKYEYSFQYIDHNGTSSDLIVNVNLIKPDSCIFKSWLSNNKGKRYTKDDNYQEYIGGIFATTNRDSIEFFTKRIIEGGNENLSPLLTLIKRKNEYFIYSFLTSPPHNGIVEMPIQKIK